MKIKKDLHEILSDINEIKSSQGFFFIKLKSEFFLYKRTTSHSPVKLFWSICDYYAIGTRKEMDVDDTILFVFFFHHIYGWCLFNLPVRPMNRIHF